MNHECLCMVELWTLGQLQGRGGAVCSRGCAREAGGRGGGDWANEIFLFIVRWENRRGECVQPAEKFSFMGERRTKEIMCV